MLIIIILLIRLQYGGIRPRIDLIVNWQLIVDISSFLINYYWLLITHANSYNNCIHLYDTCRLQVWFSKPSSIIYDSIFCGTGNDILNGSLTENAF